MENSGENAKKFRLDIPAEPENAPLVISNCLVKVWFFVRVVLKLDSFFKNLHDFQVYFDGDSFKLNDIVEFAGVFTIDDEARLLD